MMMMMMMMKTKFARKKCRMLLSLNARRESPFHAAISGVIYHWADIMASCFSHRYYWGGCMACQLTS